MDTRDIEEECAFLRHQFPMVKVVSPTVFTGLVRCEGGPVKELADSGTWPFTEYVKWHKFRMELSFLHPYSPPKVTWLTDIPHPNIIPHKTGKVCVNILGKGWLPQTKLAAVVYSLYFLLSDPNPYNAYPDKKCKEVGELIKHFDFPRRRLMMGRGVTCPHCNRYTGSNEGDVTSCVHCGKSLGGD